MLLLLLALAGFAPLGVAPYTPTDMSFPPTAGRATGQWAFLPVSLPFVSV